MWRVVHFTKEDTVEAVPVCWICEKLSECVWPPFSGKKLKTAIGSCESPKNEWMTHKVRFIGGTYDDLSKARLKAIKAESTSDLNSDCDIVRIRRKNRLYFINEEDDDTDSTKTNDTDIEMRPVIPPRLSLSQPVRSPSFKESQILTRPSIDNSLVGSQSSNKSLIVTRHSIDDLSDFEPSTNPASKIPSDPLLPFDDGFKRQVLRQLSIITIKLDQLSEDSAVYKSKQAEFEENATSDSILNKFGFPLQNMDDLQLFEQFLSVQENANQFVKEISRLGGGTPKIMIRRIMPRLFTNTLAMEYSWLGFKKKKNFSTLHLAPLIIGAVQKVHDNVTESEIEIAIKLWLVKAKERSDKRCDIGSFAI